ncbi:hypothetical protein U1Q18_040930 [Sarracenia purpurea var. burkii]
MGTIHIGSESMMEIDLACQDAVNGLPSRRPIIEMTIPSALDMTISPPGKHVINLFIQYTPYKPSEGSWEDTAYRWSNPSRPVFFFPISGSVLADQSSSCARTFDRSAR